MVLFALRLPSLQTDTTLREDDHDLLTRSLTYVYMMRTFASVGIVKFKVLMSIPKFVERNDDTAVRFSDDVCIIITNLDL